MAYERPGEKLTAHAADADLSSSQYLAAYVSAEGLVGVADGTSDEVVGVLQGTPIADEACEVMTTGTSKVISGAAIVAGVGVEVDAAGKFITLSAGTKVGVCLLPASGADEIITILLGI